MNKKCSVEDCNNEKGNGDIYFCNSCRFNWKTFLGDIGFKMLNKADELILLKKFRKGEK